MSAERPALISEPKHSEENSSRHSNYPIPIKYKFNILNYKDFPHKHAPDINIVQQAGDPLHIYLKCPDDVKSCPGFNLKTFQEKKESWASLLNPTLSSFDTNTYDPNSIPFTQGLMFSGQQTMIESTGLNHGSLIREFDLLSGETINYTRMPDSLFGEGITFVYIYHDDSPNVTCDKGKSTSSKPIKLKLFLAQLTWKNKVLIIYDYPSLHPIITFDIKITGWGLVSNFDNDILRYSDCSPSSMPTQLRLWATTGSHELVEFDAEHLQKVLHDYIDEKSKKTERKNVSSFKLLKLPELGRKVISYKGNYLAGLNEMEYDPIRKTIYANKFYDFDIYEIDPETGYCSSVFTLKKFNDPMKYVVKDSNNVMNGIAIRRDKEKKSTFPLFYITGKRWEKLYLLELGGS